MRKLKLQVQMSVDGYMAGPNGEMDWMVWNWDDDLKSFVTDITESIGCIVLGRNLAQGFIPHWAAVAANPSDPEFEAGKKFTSAPKVVFTKTLDKSAWDNTVLAKGNLVDEIMKLKQQDDKDIIAYGGGTFVSNLIKHDLIDELHLFVNPTALGGGMAIFKELKNMKLVHTRTFSCGIVVLSYEPVK
jgi:dihydrofolate reductase